jgi:transcriptional regulator with XRE-family HTH domain
MDLKKFGRNVTKIRLKYMSEISFSEAAQRARVTYHQLQKIEKGLMNPTILTIFKMAESWNIPISEFFRVDQEEVTKQVSDIKK